MTRIEYESLKRKLKATYETNLDALERVWELSGKDSDADGTSPRSAAMKASWVKRRAKKAQK